MSAFLSILQRDLLLAFRNPSQVINAVLFFILVLMLFPFGVGYGPNQLNVIAPGVIWVSALLSTLLSLGQLFSYDAENGFLDYILSSPTNTSTLVYAKLISHWLITGLPIILLTPLLSLFYNLPATAIYALVFTLILGTPSLTAIGAIGAALTVNIKHSNVLLALIILPLYIPIIIFAASAVSAANDGLGYTGQLYFLAAFLVMALTLAPFAIAAALRLSAQ